jgi:hypothetical protein
MIFSLRGPAGPPAIAVDPTPTVLAVISRATGSIRQPDNDVCGGGVSDVTSPTHGGASPDRDQGPDGRRIIRAARVR